MRTERRAWQVVAQIYRNAMHAANLIVALLAVAPCPASAEEHFTRCAPIPGQSQVVKIPSKLGQLLLSKDHTGSDQELPCCGRWWEKDPNDLYLAKAFDLNGDGVDEYLVRAKPGGPREFGHNNPIWIVKQGEYGFDILYSGYAGLNGGPVAVKGYTRGYSNICVMQTTNSSNKKITILKYHQNHYIQSECRSLKFGSGKGPPEDTIDECNNEHTQGNP